MPGQEIDGEFGFGIEGYDDHDGHECFAEFTKLTWRHALNDIRDHDEGISRMANRVMAVRIREACGRKASNWIGAVSSARSEMQRIMTKGFLARKQACPSAAPSISTQSARISCRSLARTYEAKACRARTVSSPFTGCWPEKDTKVSPEATRPVTSFRC